MVDAGVNTFLLTLYVQNQQINQYIKEKEYMNSDIMTVLTILQS